MNTLVIRQIPGLTEYRASLAAMQAFTESRRQDTSDEIWCLEHAPVYTLGMAGKQEHILAPGGIGVIKTDRGGQVTFHGPGQLVIYLLLDLKRGGLSIKRYVRLLEQALINMLADFSIDAARKERAPGVYIQGRKIAALGVRVRRGCCYHGLALNVAMDLSPFSGINPCGYPGLEVTQLKDQGIDMTVIQAGNCLVPYLIAELGFTGYLKRTVKGLERRVNHTEAVA